MATIGGVNSTKTGLVFVLDAGNIKSFRGEPTTNLSNNFRDFTGTTYSPGGEWPGTTVTKTYFSELSTPIGPGATLMNESTSSGYQGLSRYGGSNESGAHSLSAFIYPLTSNITEFTIGLLADSSNMIYFNLVTGAITYGAGISNRNSVLESVPNWPGWYRIGANFEGRVGGWVGSMGYSMYTTYSGSGVLKSMYITGVQYELKSYPTPFVSGTRGTTVATGGGWGDMSGNSNHGELVNNPIFNNRNGGNIQFDGITSSAHCAYTKTDLDGNVPFSVEGVFLRTGSFSNGGPWGIGGNSSLGGINCWNWNQSNHIAVDLWGTTTYTTGQLYPLNQPAHIIWVYRGTSFVDTNLSIFINGVEYTGASLTNLRGTSATPNLNTSTQGISLGRINVNQNQYFAPIAIYNFKVYNRALSSGEALQNYNAMRGRFGI